MKIGPDSISRPSFFSFSFSFFAFTSEPQTVVDSPPFCPIYQKNTGMGMGQHIH